MTQPETFALPSGLRQSINATVDFAAEQLVTTAEKWPPEKPAPVHTLGGAWYRPRDLWTDWTPGFLAGQYWILYRVTGEERWRQLGEAYTRKLKPRRFDRDVHDLGFVFLSSYARWLSCVPEDSAEAEVIRNILVTAATVQSYRWNGGGEHGFIYSFNGPQSLFVDIMMNVRLLFWASQHDAGEQVLQRAIEHCRTSARFLVRRDGPGLGEVAGSVVHEAIFNTEPGRGEFRCLSTQQGYSPFTCWSRGLAWAAYGFAEANRYTGESEFLEVAERCAGFYLEHTPDPGVPYWDYGAPNIPDEPVDSSAAAVMGCAFLLLAAKKTPRAAAYRDMALRIATTLTATEYLAKGYRGEEGILLHGVYHRPRGWGVDSSVMWGEYFFLEFLERLLEDAGELRR